MPKIPLGQWVPDADPYGSPHLVDVSNLRFTPGGWVPQLSLTITPGALTNTPQGFYSGFLENGSAITLTGDSRTLYRRNSNGTWTDLVTGNSSTQNKLWSFASIGNAVYAASEAGPIQKVTGTNRSTITDSPRCRYIAVIRGFLVAAYLSDNIFRIQWAANDLVPERWNIDNGEGGFLDAQESYGPIAGLTGGRRGLLIQSDLISEIRDVGAAGLGLFPSLYGTGTESAGSIIQVESGVYMWSRQGFIFTDGTQITPIGEAKVDDWFRDRCSNFLGIVGAHDVEHTTVCWSFTSDSGSNKTDILTYDYLHQTWGHVEIPHSFLCSTLSDEKILDNLDSEIPNINVSSISVDSDTFRAGGRQLAAFDTSNKLGTFNGDPLPSSFKTSFLANRESTPQLLKGVRLTLSPNSVRRAFLIVSDGIEERTLQGVYNTRAREYQGRLRDRYAQVEVELTGNFPEISHLVLNLMDDGGI